MEATSFGLVIPSRAVRRGNPRDVESDALLTLETVTLRGHSPEESPRCVCLAGRSLSFPFCKMRVPSNSKVLTVCFLNCQERYNIRHEHKESVI